LDKRFRNLDRRRELQYLHEDLMKRILSLPDKFELEEYEQNLVAQIHLKVQGLSTLELGEASILDAVQYLLGELKIGYEDQDPLNHEAAILIDQIQDYLDWFSR